MVEKDQASVISHRNAALGLPQSAGAGRRIFEYSLSFIGPKTYYSAIALSLLNNLSPKLALSNHYEIR